MASSTRNVDLEFQEEIEIEIHNVSAKFDVKCRLDILDIAQRGMNIILKNNDKLIMLMHGTSAEACIRSSGNITCSGAKSEEEAKSSSRKFARILQKLGYDVKFTKYQVYGVMGTCHLPFGVNELQFALKYGKVNPVKSYF